MGLSPEEQQRWARRLARHLAAATRTLARLFLVHSVPESLKVTVTPRGGHGGTLRVWGDTQGVGIWRAWGT